MKLCCSRIVSAHINKIRHAFALFRDTIKNGTLARKVYATAKMETIGSKWGLILLRKKFEDWRDNEFVRKLRLMKKYMHRWIFTSSISYQSAFWRWEYVVMKSGKELEPRHMVMAKKLSNLFEYNQKKSLQFTFFKLMIYEASPDPSPRKSGGRKSLYESQEARKSSAGKISEKE
jgi:hypothetical protein